MIVLLDNCIACNRNGFDILYILGCSYEDISGDCGDLNYTIDQLALAFSSRYISKLK